MKITQNKHKKQSKGHNFETEKRKVTIVIETCCLDLIHIPI